MARAPRRGRRRTDKELLLDTLTELSGQGQRSISNPTLREAVGWDEQKYQRIKEQLIREQLLVTGRGRGGSVGLRAPPGAKALKLFISYCHADEQAKTELLRHLEPLKRMKLIETWHDRQLRAGEQWDRTISRHLNEADIIILIISIDFINSEYCYDIELEKAMERNQNGSARVVPVIYRNCIWGHAPFAALQAVPADAKPICSWDHLDDAYVDVAQRIKDLCEELLRER